ncbi:MAG TPA: hypothetical protein VLI90_08390 [Tepidisphaeraceae bacterium]|nr:hypothetical protein [Tepidisphaeraceae bacterium]
MLTISLSLRSWSALACGLLASALIAPAHATVTFAQLDDFQDGTTMGWQQGFQATNPPANVATGGPAGAGDRYLQNISTGGFGASSRQVMFNNAQWTGDFFHAGVTRINAMLANFGSTTLSMRVAMQGGTNFSEYSSTNAISLPADGAWHAVTFEMDPTTMTLVAGTDPLSDVLSSVIQFRMLSSSSGPTYTGADPIASTLGVDNVRALTLPGDATLDGKVDVADLGVLATNYSLTGDWSKGDFNFDGNVNVGDLGALATNYNTSIPTGASVAAAEASVAVPEPGGMVVLISAGVLWSIRRLRLRNPSGVVCQAVSG